MAPHLLTLPSEVRNQIWTSIINPDLIYNITPACYGQHHYGVVTSWAGAMRCNKQMASETRSQAISQIGPRKMITTLGFTREAARRAHLATTASMYLMESSYWYLLNHIHSSEVDCLRIEVFGLSDEGVLTMREEIQWPCLKDGVSSRTGLSPVLLWRLDQSTMGPSKPRGQSVSITDHGFLFEALGLLIVPSGAVCAAN